MSVLIAIGQIGEKSREIKAEKLAKKDLTWWRKKIAEANLSGNKSYANYSSMTNPLYVFSGYWTRRCTDEYAAALKKLLPSGFKVESLRDEEGAIGITISW